MKFKTLAAAYEEFSKHSIPPTAGEMQREAMKLSFYAGVSAIMGMQLDIPDETSDEVGAAMLKGWYAEIGEYAANQLVGAIIKQQQEKKQ